MTNRARQYMKPMDPRALRRLRARAGWSQPALAALLEVHPLTVYKWERGTHPIPRMAAIACRSLAAEFMAGGKAAE